jgi:histone-lysine N-methyltransferase SETMAR
MENVNGASRLRKFWNFFCLIQMSSFPARLVAMDETWLYHYDPETKQQSTEWRHSVSPHHHKKFQVQKSAGKILASNFWDQDGILLIDYLRSPRFLTSLTRS